MRNYASVREALLLDLEPYLRSDSMYLTDMSLDEAFARSLADSFYKKLCPLGNSKEADEKALKKFIAINASISVDPFEFSAQSEVESRFEDFFTENLNECLDQDWGDTPFNLEYIREKMRTGPGSAQKADSRSFVTKLFESDLSYTDEYLLSVYRSALVDTGLWADAEMLRTSQYRTHCVKGGKLFFAKKNAEISRTCCTEANLNMLIQMAIGAFIEERMLRYFGVSLASQPEFNRELARIGSIDDSFGTIDLVSASDSISWQLVQSKLRNNSLLGMMRVSRSEQAILPDGSVVALSMISTMGNGFTFPLQTVIFASAIKAAYQVMGLPFTSPRTDFGVFGDDIIVRRQVYDFIVRMLAKLGFEVNDAKSFNSGPFRESCGHDYFRGVNIRGVYIRSLETPQEICSALNRLNRWTAYSGIPLSRTCLSLIELLDNNTPVVPFSEDDQSGLKLPFVHTIPVVDNHYWFKYRKWVKHKRRMKVEEPDESINPFGTALGFLSGHIRQADDPSIGQESERHVSWLSRDLWVSLRDPPDGRSSFKIRSKNIPYWDYEPRESFHDPMGLRIGYQGNLITIDGRWKAAVEANLCL
jgi:hypothetical protein